MPLKVGIVGPPLSDLFGGQEVQAAALFDLWRGDPDVAATFISSRPALPMGLRKVNRVPYLRTAIRLPFYLLHLLRSLRKVEVVHIFAGSFSTFLIASAPAFFVAKLLRNRVLINYRNGRGGEHLKRSSLARYILRSSDAVVVPSEYLEKSFRDHGVRSVVIKNVVDQNRFCHRERLPLQPKLLCTRNLEALYGIDTVVRAFARVQRDFPEASLCLVGSGRQESEIRKLVAVLALNHVEFMGAVHPDAIPAIYDQADIFVNGSYIDCAPVSILEAFCSGLPVATTAAGGIPHLVDHGRTGLLSEPGNWEDLAQNVVRILRDSTMARSLAAEAYKQAGQHSWQNLHPLWLRVYGIRGESRSR
jgi:glycosyltransferase involved in cell wall biosynthesis